MQPGTTAVMNASIAKDGSQGHRTCNAMPNIVDFAISLSSLLSSCRCLPLLGAAWPDRVAVHSSSSSSVCVCVCVCMCVCVHAGRGLACASAFQTTVYVTVVSRATM